MHKQSTAPPLNSEKAYEVLHATMLKSSRKLQMCYHPCCTRCTVTCISAF